MIEFDIAGTDRAAVEAEVKTLCDRLLANTRETDVVGRLGGDEFAVVLVQADLETAAGKAETLRKVIEDTPMNLGDWSAPIRVSYGIRPVEAGADPETALAEADAAMFVRKRAKGSRAAIS